MITNEQTLKIVESLIEQARWARSAPTAPEHEIYVALKEVAADIRARMPGRANRIKESLQRRIDFAIRSCTIDGIFQPTALAGIGEEVMGSWLTISHALECLDQEARKNGHAATAP